MTATPNLREGDVVLVVAMGGPQVHRAGSFGAMTEWREVRYVQPEPATRWEFRKPATSARWSVYFAHGGYAGGTLTSEWILRCHVILGHEDEGGEHRCALPAGHGRKQHTAIA